MSELRAWIGAELTISSFVTNRELRVVDCTGRKGPDLRTALDDPGATEMDGMWAMIDHWFARPVRKEEQLEYVPTQILSELFADLGYDGVRYVSLLDVGAHNYALFDVDVADVEERKMAKVTSVKYEFSARSNTV